MVCESREMFLNQVDEITKMIKNDGLEKLSVDRINALVELAILWGNAYIALIKTLDKK